MSSFYLNSKKRKHSVPTSDRLPRLGEEDEEQVDEEVEEEEQEQVDEEVEQEENDDDDGDGDDNDNDAVKADDVDEGLRSQLVTIVCDKYHKHSWFKKLGSRDSANRISLLNKKCTEMLKRYWGDAAMTKPKPPDASSSTWPPDDDGDDGEEDKKQPPPPLRSLERLAEMIKDAYRIRLWAKKNPDKADKANKRRRTAPKKPTKQDVKAAERLVNLLDEKCRNHDWFLELQRAGALQSTLYHICLNTVMRHPDWTEERLFKVIPESQRRVLLNKRLAQEAEDEEDDDANKARSKSARKATR